MRTSPGRSNRLAISRLTALECGRYTIRGEFMTLERKLAVVGIALILHVLPGATQAQGQAQERYKVRLATVPMDGGMRNTVAGTGSATAVLTGTKLTVTGTFDGLLPPATAAHVHRGAAMGVRGSSFA